MPEPSLSLKPAGVQLQRSAKVLTVIRNKTATLIRTSKRDVFVRSIAGDKDSSFLWKHVRNISRKNNEKQIPQEIIIDNESINEKLISTKTLISSFLKSAKS